MIRANFYRNASVKIKKICLFFFLKLVNTNVCITHDFNYIENLIIFKFCEFFSSWNGCGFVVQLVAAKDMFFFT